MPPSEASPSGTSDVRHTLPGRWARGRLEQLAISGQAEPAGAALLDLLTCIDSRGRVDGLDHADPLARRVVYTRLASAATMLMCRAGARLSLEGLYRFSVLKPAWATLFGASGFAGCAHLPALLAAANPVTGPHAKSGVDLLTLLAISTPDSLPDAAIEMLPGLPSEVRAATVLGLLACPVVLSQRAEHTRSRLLDDCERLLHDVTLPTALLPAAFAAWMQCSYATCTGRHRLKPVLNQLFAAWMQSHGIVPAPLPPSRPHRERPRLLVLAELMGSRHAMYRCFGNPIRSAEAHFETIVMCSEDAIDDRARSGFARVETFPNRLDYLPTLLERIQAIQPDLILYPSIGMQPWAILCANLRLAPIQVMSAGHPASSFCPTIDYYVSGRDLISETAEFSEKVVALRTPGIGKQPSPVPVDIEPKPRAKPEVLRVAVSSQTCKLNAGFVAACRRIAELAGRRLSWTFFPNEPANGRLDELQQILQAQLGDVVVHPRADYRQYMQWLDDCDLALGTFPFGGSNSNTDVYLLGKPKVCLRGDEPAARTDERSLRAFGMPDWMCADNVDGYVDAAVRIIRDDALRLQLARHILDFDPAKVLFGGEQHSHPDELAKALLWILHNHDRLQPQSQRFFYPDYD